MAVFPGTLEPLVGVSYGKFSDAWGVSRGRFEALTLGTLVVIVLVALLGYATCSRVREQVVVDVPLETALSD